MITLQFRRISRASSLEPNNVVHLKIIKRIEDTPGKWRLIVDDVTPLLGAEPTGYACHMCGIIEEAKPDGSLPDGWVEKKYEEGSCFVCEEKICQNVPMCRICGCTREYPCFPVSFPCYWVKPDLCSACAEKGR